jgi:glycosyltransferase involved in cell wall biosynthesis
MKIIVVVRTMNEESNIGRFCQSYEWADKILVSDGGSTDRSEEIAAGYGNVELIPFREVVSLENGGVRNPPGPHINFMIEEAKANERGADWIIFDDCDCVPNKLLRQGARGIIEAMTNRIDVLAAKRVYFYGDRILPKLHKPGAGLWAWRPRADVSARTDIGSLHVEMKINAPDNRWFRFEFPYCLLHYPWPDPEAVARKLDYYRAGGIHPEMLHPLDFGGQLADPEWFMSEQ